MYDDHVPSVPPFLLFGTESQRVMGCIVIYDLFGLESQCVDDSVCCFVVENERDRKRKRERESVYVMQWLQCHRDSAWLRQLSASRSLCLCFL